MLENVQFIHENGESKFAVIDFKEFALIKDLLTNVEKLEDYLDYLHIQTIKQQDKLPRHSLNDIVEKLKIQL
jgi:hypothetical protein